MLDGASAGCRRGVSPREPLPAIRYTRPGVCLRYAFHMPAAQLGGLAFSPRICYTRVSEGKQERMESNLEWRRRVHDSRRGTRVPRRVEAEDGTASTRRRAARRDGSTRPALQMDSAC